MAGVLTTFVFLARSGASAASYMTMDMHSRRAVEYFSRDVLMASSATWNSATSITLTVPTRYATASNRVTYAWDGTAGSATYRSFYMMPGEANASNPVTVLASNVTALSFSCFDRANQSTTDPQSIKRIRLDMTLQANSAPLTTTTDHVAASFVLRNKLQL